MPTVAEPQVPPLVEGERLSRDEFLRRWDAHPEIKKAELIGGVVYMPSPVCGVRETSGQPAKLNGRA